MKRIWLSILFVLLAGVVFANMDSERFYAALNLKLGIAAYGIIHVDTDSSLMNKGEDKNGDGVILVTYAEDTWTNVFAIGNANNGRYMMVILSNNGGFENNYSKVKVYKLDYSNIKEQFIKDFESTRASILGISSSSSQNNTTRSTLASRPIPNSQSTAPEEPDDAVTYFNSGKMNFNRHDYDRAIADFTQAIQRDSYNAVYRSERAYTYAWIGEFDKAIADATQAIMIDPNYATAYFNRGMAYDSKRDDDRAMADYNQTIRLDPKHAHAYYNRGNIYYLKQDYEKAIVDYTQSIKSDPNKDYAYLARGKAYEKKGDYGKAIADYTKTLKVNPANNYAKSYLEGARKARGR